MIRHVIALGFCCAVGCGQVLGIDEAFVDPALGSAGKGGSGAGGATTGGRAAVGDAGEASSTGGAVNTVDGCDQYCDLMGEYCVDEGLQYRNTEQCLRICRALPVGEIEDDRVNTASCRRRYAGKARYLGGPELAANCRYAGPGGDGRCGSNCEGLCTIAMSACAVGVSEPYLYRSFDDCLADCEGLPNSAYVYGTVSVGNSLECRLFHASSAIMEDPSEHCEHVLGVTLCAEQE